MANRHVCFAREHTAEGDGGRKPTFFLQQTWRGRRMAADLEKIRTAAERVAGSYGLEVVDVEFVGGGKHRVLRVAIEKDAAGRARLAAEAKAAAERGTASEDGLVPAAVLRGELSTEHLLALRMRIASASATISAR